MAETNLAANKATAEYAGSEVTRGGAFYSPRVDIYETADEVALICDLPGVRPQDLDVQFVKRELTLCGKVEPRQAPAEYAQQEYGVGDFYRSFAIAPEIDAGKISAESRDGVLTVHLPKPEKAKPKRIIVKSA